MGLDILGKCKVRLGPSKARAYSQSPPHTHTHLDMGYKEVEKLAGLTPSWMVLIPVASLPGRS